MNLRAKMLEYVFACLAKDEIKKEYIDDGLDYIELSKDIFLNSVYLYLNSINCASVEEIKS